MTFEEFIIQHEKDDTAKLLLGRGKWPEIDIDLAVNTIECRKAIKAKLPDCMPTLNHLSHKTIGRAMQLRGDCFLQSQSLQKDIVWK
jgi:hypothetical protein